MDYFRPQPPRELEFDTEEDASQRPVLPRWESSASWCDGCLAAYTFILSGA